MSHPTLRPRSFKKQELISTEIVSLKEENSSLLKDAANSLLKLFTTSKGEDNSHKQKKCVNFDKAEINTYTHNSIKFVRKTSDNKTRKFTNTVKHNKNSSNQTQESDKTSPSFAAREELRRAQRGPVTKITKEENEAPHRSVTRTTKEVNETHHGPVTRAAEQLRKAKLQKMERVI